MQTIGPSTSDPAPPPETMGSLPQYSPSDDVIPPPLRIDETTLFNLFRCQQKHLNSSTSSSTTSLPLKLYHSLVPSFLPPELSSSPAPASPASSPTRYPRPLSPSSSAQPSSPLSTPSTATSGFLPLATSSSCSASPGLPRSFSASFRTRGLRALTSPRSRPWRANGNALAAACDMNVHLPLERELCPFNLAPVTSTAVQMVFGDTVAIALMGARSLTKEEYAANHPAGRIGKSLIFKAKDVMKKQEELPVCREGDLIMDQLVELMELTSKGCGCLVVIDEEYHLIGTFTDGDLRRTLKASGEAIFKLTVGEMCNRMPRTINPDSMAVEAMKKMEAPPSPVQFLPVVDDRNKLIGIVTLHGLVSAGI